MASCLAREVARSVTSSLGETSGEMCSALHIAV
jgi:hypothetical protein